MVDVFRQVIGLLMQVIDLLLIAFVVAVVAMVVLRWILLKVQPFGWLAYYVRRVTDPMVWPIASRMPNNAEIAPLILLIAALVGAYFFKEFTGEVLVSLLGMVNGLATGRLLMVLGWLLYGAVSILLLLIIVRIVMTWIPGMRDGRFMWTLYSLTEPIMAPFRQLIPPLGMFDLSPILLMFLMSFVKSAIYKILIQ